MAPRYSDDVVQFPPHGLGKCPIREPLLLLLIHSRDRGSIRPGPPNRLRTRAIAAFSHSFSIPTPGFQQSPLVPPFPCLPFPPPPTHFVRSHKTTKTTDAPGWMDRRRAVGLSAVRTQPIHPIPFPCPPPALSANLVRCRPPRDPFDTSPKGNPEEGVCGPQSGGGGGRGGELSNATAIFPPTRT